MYFKTTGIAGLSLFCRDAGHLSKPTVIPLHGIPSSSLSFRDLMACLADRFPVIAPDFPAWGSGSISLKENSHVDQ